MLLKEKDLLQEIVRIPSVNPDFETPGGVFGGEAALTAFLQDFLQQQGWPWLRQNVHPGRDNLLAVCRPGDAAASAEVMLWEVHQDTVGVAGMQIDPFAASESQGRIWGRGACDNKGGMAAMLTALVRAQAVPAEQRPTILLAFTINEENGFTGAKALCRLWEQQEQKNVSGPLSPDKLRRLTPNKVIVAEPTQLDTVVAHKGGVRWRCVVHGRAAHSSQPERGVNAIEAMAEVVQAIVAYQRDVLDLRQAHPLCGGPTVCVSTIQGGAGVNTVPDHAVIDIDRRLAPGENLDRAYGELVDFVAAALEKSPAVVEHQPPTCQFKGLEDHNNRPWGEQIAATVQTLDQTSQLLGVPYGTNAWVFAEQGWPTVVFGPGSIDQAHTDDEWISLEQLSQATEVFYRIAISGS
ncbi:MAG: M20 family metallopeptidase [Pirellulales bacterium]|nr:M20 family metallopeptidase [Pirellulales bacterium]